MVLFDPGCFAVNKNFRPNFIGCLDFQNDSCIQCVVASKYFLHFEMNFKQLKDLMKFLAPFSCAKSGIFVE